MGEAVKVASLLAAGMLLVGCIQAPQLPVAPGKTDLAKGCGDLLTEIGRKPALARYMGCETFPDEQGAPMRATYDVAGRDAAAVEAELIRTTGLKPLKRSCCQWDGDFANFEDGRGGRLLISMTSEQGPVSRREDWGEIALFRVTVTRLTEEL